MILFCFKIFKVEFRWDVTKHRLIDFFTIAAVDL